jgi:spore maturation protein CgeB
VLTANRWGAERTIETALEARTADRGAIYGSGWEAVTSLRPLVRGALAYDQLSAAYQDAKLVLDDTAEPTLVYDAVNSRVFDALASGALVLTNCERGVRELFDAEFPTWSSAAEMGVRLDELLRNPRRRSELAERYRREVLERHTYERRIRQLTSFVREQNDALVFSLKVGAPDPIQAERWGDLHFARALARALRRLGHRTRVEILPEWTDPASAMSDIAVHIRGRSDYRPRPGQFNVLWAISHPETLDHSLAAAYDLICVASEAYARELSDRIAVPVRVLEQATDPRIFFRDPEPARAHDLVFVGNSRGVTRKILEDLLPTDLDLAVLGGGWRGTRAAGHVVAEHIPNDELRKVYSSAAIVLCDHWPDMRSAGFRSNRLYDALACGAMVVCDDVAGLTGSLGDAVVTYGDSSELDPLLRRLLADPEERARRTRGARQRVLDGETFDDRARSLLQWVEELRTS